jgi:dTMP kinase
MTRLIVLEGLDGAGTTTQAKRLLAYLQGRGHRSHGTREPSDGPIGRLIREMLTGHHAILEPSNPPTPPAGPPKEGHVPVGSIGQSTFGLLFAADRLDHLQREVLPQLAAGAIVISDRWYHSSLAYQGTGADRDWITALNARARKPDLTLFLQVRPEVAAQRRVAAGRVQELFDDLRLQHEVDAGYRATIAELTAQGERIEVIDGELPADAVFQMIVAIVGALLDEPVAPVAPATPA